MTKKAIRPSIKIELVDGGITAGTIEFSAIGSIEDLAQLLSVSGTVYERFEEALNLAILQIREAKAAEQG